MDNKKDNDSAFCIDTKSSSKLTRKVSSRKKIPKSLKAKRSDNDSNPRIKKQERINQAIGDESFLELRRLALSPLGLINNELRSKAWAILLKTFNKQKLKQKTHRHSDEAQIDLDINRSLNSYPRGLSKTAKDALRVQLATLIKKVLRAEPPLCYFQGYHDIAACVLLVMGPSRATCALHHLSLFYIRDSMQSNLEPVIQQLNLIFIIIRLVDKKLHQFLEECEVPPYYALSWVLTWGTHDVKELELAARLVEFVLASEPYMPLYIAAAITLHYRDEIVSLEPDYAMVHTSLSKLFNRIVLNRLSEPEKAGSIDLELLLRKSLHLFQAYPLTKLRKESASAWLHPNSCINIYDPWFLNVHSENVHSSIDHIQELMEDGDLNQPIQKSVAIWRHYFNRDLPQQMDGWTLCIGVVVMIGISWKYHSGDFF